MSFSDAITFAPKSAAPSLTDGTIVLRPHELRDADLFWEFYQSDRAAFVGAPKTKTHLWYGLGSEIASWPLKGMGAWAIERNKVMAGQVAITQPPHFPEIEIGWILFAGFEGQGLAERAARLALAWFWENTDQDSLVSYITPENTRSIALAMRLGAMLDPDAVLPDGETPEETVVYRHRRPA